MRQDKKTKIESSGWKIANVADFLNLTKEAVEEVELRLSTDVQVGNSSESKVAIDRASADYGH